MVTTFDVFHAGSDRVDHQAALRGFRHEQPVAEVDDRTYLVTRHGDVKEILRDFRSFSSAGNFTLVSPDEEPERELILQHDPPFHTALRRVELPAFTRGSIRDERAWIDERVRALLDRAEEGSRPLEFMSEVAIPLTTFVIASLVGLPKGDLAELAGWVRDISSHRPYPVYELESWKSLSSYLRSCAEKDWEQPEPSEDIIGRLTQAAADGLIGEEDIPIHVYQLFTAGTETTAYTLGFTLLELLRRPDGWGRLSGEWDAIFPAVREEGLRFTTAIRLDFRIATRDVEIAGVTIPEGSRVVLSLESANRDEQLWEDPDSFRLDRGEDHRHLAFGYGAHLCLGASLARSEIEAVLLAMTRRYPELALDASFVERRVPSIVLNGLERLDLELGAAARS